MATIKSNESEMRTIEVVKENIDKFTTKTVKLVKGAERKLFVESVEWDSWDSPILSHKNSGKMSNNVKYKFRQKCETKLHCHTCLRKDRNVRKMYDLST